MPHGENLQNVFSFDTRMKGSAAFCSKLPKLYSLIVHDMRLKMDQMGHVTLFSTLAHKFVVVLQFQNMLWRYAFFQEIL